MDFDRGNDIAETLRTLLVSVDRTTQLLHWEARIDVQS